MLGIIFRVAIHLGGIYIGWRLGRKISKWVTKRKQGKKWNKERENLLSISPLINNIRTDIKKVPQVSFERFLKLYEVSPEKWIITEDSYGYTKYFPIYVKYDTEIPLFWETGEDLQKYREWVKEKFFKGEAALYQQARDESMKLLTKFIKEDLEKKRKRAEEEIAELEAQVKKECEQTKEKQKEIKLTLEPSSPTWYNEGDEPVLSELKYTTQEVMLEPSNETSVFQSAVENTSTCVQPTELNTGQICSIRDQLLSQQQSINMEASQMAQFLLMNAAQASIQDQFRYSNVTNCCIQRIQPSFGWYYK